MYGATSTISDKTDAADGVPVVAFRRGSIGSDHAEAETSALIGESTAYSTWMFPPRVFEYQPHKEAARSSRSRRRRVEEFYKRQDELVDTYKKIYTDICQADESAPAVFHEPGDNESTRSIRLAQLSLFVNVALTVAKAVAIYLSGSLSVISSLIDSIIDLVSGIVVWVANRQVKTRNPYYYPQGKTRLEPIAIVILAVIMSTATVQIVIQAFTTIINMAVGSGGSAENGTYCGCPDGDNGTIYVPQEPTGQAIDWFNVFGLVGAVIVAKLILFILCYKFGTTSSTGALAQDHKNDVVSNTTVLIMTVLSVYIWPYFDAIGALAISMYIIYTWVDTLQQQVRMLTGYTADPESLKQIIFICINHHPLIRHIDTVRAFHIGNNHLVEVDIVLPEQLDLREAHDIGESLQRKIEMLDWVERAFVHLDYEFDHHPSTEHKQM